MSYDNPRTIQHRWEKLRDQFVSKKAKEEPTAGIEDFGEDDPFNQLVEDLLMEIKDHEVEKEQKRENKKSREESLHFELLPHQVCQILKHLQNALLPAARSGVPLSEVPLKLTCWSKVLCSMKKK